MSLLLDAVARGHLSYEDVTRVYSERPAQVYGLWPRKGRIAVGSDADLVLVDPAAQRTLRDEDVLSKAGWTPFAGRTVRGRVVQTYLRGTLVAEEGRPQDARTGRLVLGPGADAEHRRALGGD
jgi:dihydroorotase-like cyclic amidohydrolase